MINHELLSQFASRGLTINKGTAVDARLVQWASHPLSQKKLEEEKKKGETPQGNQGDQTSIGKGGGRHITPGQ
ncbi:MAG: hypothetical protein ABSH06_00700 [Thermodesulfobacteriota bacterium]